MRECRATNSSLNKVMRVARARRQPARAWAPGQLANCSSCSAAATTASTSSWSPASSGATCPTIRLAASGRSPAANWTHWGLDQGSDTNILLWLDDQSRFLISATAHTVVTTPIVLDTFTRACAEHGIPAATLTDNGFVFTTRSRHGPNAFETRLAHLGIQQRNGSPNHPQTQGKVERLNQTLKRWLTAQPPATDLATLQTQLDEFTDLYNTRRPHRSLACRTPLETYTARAKATPTTRLNQWRTRTDKIFRGGNVTLRVHGRLHHIGLGKSRAGTPVQLLIRDLDVTIIDTTTGEILRELTIDTTRDYQPRGVNPGPTKQPKT